MSILGGGGWVKSLIGTMSTSMSLCEDRISNIQNQVPHREWRSDSLELLRLTQTRLPEQHFFPASKIRQRSLLCWRSCTDSLPTPGVRKKSTSGASQWINFHNSKTFVNYFRYRTSFLMLENPIQHSPGAQRILLATHWSDLVSNHKPYLSLDIWYWQ